VVKIGAVCPQGFLPVYSTDTKEEAKQIVVLACPTNYDGDYVAPEVAGTTGDERISQFVAFGKRLEQIHKMIMEKKHGLHN